MIAFILFLPYLTQLNRSVIINHVLQNLARLLRIHMLKYLYI